MIFSSQKWGKFASSSSAHISVEVYVTALPSAKQFSVESENCGWAQRQRHGERKTTNQQCHRCSRTVRTLTHVSVVVMLMTLNLVQSAGKEGQLLSGIWSATYVVSIRY